MSRSREEGKNVFKGKNPILSLIHIVEKYDSFGVDDIEVIALRKAKNNKNLIRIGEEIVIL